MAAWASASSTSRCRRCRSRARRDRSTRRGCSARCRSRGCHGRRFLAYHPRLQQHRFRVTQSPMRRPSGRPSSGTAAPPDWSAAASTLARQSAGTSSSGCPWRARRSRSPSWRPPCLRSATRARPASARSWSTHRPWSRSRSGRRHDRHRPHVPAAAKVTRRGRRRRPGRPGTDSAGWCWVSTRGTRGLWVIAAWWRRGHRACPAWDQGPYRRSAGRNDNAWQEATETGSDGGAIGRSAGEVAAIRSGVDGRLP